MVSTTIVRRLSKDDAEAFHRLRLAGLAQSPEAFASSFAEDAALTPEAVRERFPVERDRFVLGAFDPRERLIGAVGFTRERHLKLEHWGKIWGMYVAPEARRRGVGRALVLRVVEECTAIPGLEQIVLEVATVAAAARRLYESCGFAGFGVQQDAMRDERGSYDVEHMVLLLSGGRLKSS